LTEDLTFNLCCQSGKAARRGHPKNWRGAVCGRYFMTRRLKLKVILLIKD